MPPTPDRPLPRGCRALRAAALGLCLLALPIRSAAQETPEKEVIQQQQLWLGYMSQTRVTDKFALWLDGHFVPEAFFVARTGLTWRATDRLLLTGGYAYLGLSVPGGLTADLKRTEHRPWAQGVYTSRIVDDFKLIQRVRYDARYRRQVDAGALAPGFGLTHRVRFMVGLRHNMEYLRFAKDFLPYLTLSNEALLNFGPEVVFNHLDQNRITAAAGLSRKGFSVQLGYMNRFVQLPAGDRFVMNHTLVVWVFHNIDARRREVGEPLPVGPHDEDPGPW